MFFLSLDFGVILPAALLSMALALVVLVLAFLILSALGYRVLWRKKVLRREKAVTASTVTETPLENELSEEELIVIITAAVEAVSADTKRRFRVVSFKRV